MIGTRPLGTTGARLPILGFGVSGPHATGLVPRDQTIRLVRQALEAGAILFDTAPFYGDGEAETRLGDALHGARESAFIVSKTGTVRQGRKLMKNFAPGHIIASCEESLRRLRCETLDALLLHGPRAEDMNDGVLGALDTLKRGGKIRFAGVCGRGPEIDAAIASRAFDLIMAPAGPAVARPALARAASARARGMGMLGIEIMTRAASGWRAPRSAADLWYLARRARRQILALGGAALETGQGESTPLKDLEWALAGEACDCAVITTTRASHLAANIAAAERASAGL